MKGIPQRREVTENVALGRIDQAREDLGTFLKACPFLRGRLVSVTFAAATRKVVRHGIGVAAACFVARMNYDPAENGPLFTEDSDQATGCDPTQQLALVCNVVCTVDLWFYPRASRTIISALGQSP